MSKYKKYFQDWAMQGLYERLRDDNYSPREARQEVITRFKEYDEGKPLSIFIK